MIILSDYGHKLITLILINNKLYVLGNINPTKTNSSHQSQYRLIKYNIILILLFDYVLYR